MTTPGILAYGAYVPRHRIKRQTIFDAIGWVSPSLKGLAQGSRSFGAWDEDAVTLATEAARSCLSNGVTEPQSLCFASTTGPFLDRQNAGIVATALDLPATTHVTDAAGGQRAASSALINASQHPTATTLVATGETRPTKSGSVMEMLSGDAGAAVLVGVGNAPVAALIGYQTVFDDLVDHYRTPESGTDYLLEDRWFRDAGIVPLARAVLAPLLDRYPIDRADIAHLVVSLPLASHRHAVARALEIDAARLDNNPFESCGHAGTAQPILLLANALDQAAVGDVILLLTFGQGCDAILLRKHTEQAGTTVKEIMNNGQEEGNYTKFLSARNMIEIERGIRAERDNRTAQTVAHARSRELYGFVGGICSTCGTPQFPKSRRCVNPDCAALDTQAAYRFADKNGTVKSFTEDWLAVTREPPLIYGNISFEGGGNVFMEIAGAAPGDIDIGSAVKMQFRVKDFDSLRGFRRYFWKAVPIRSDQYG